MGKLYCPYCDQKYQFSKRDNLGNLYCGLCGEYLIKKKFITIKMIVSIVAIFSITLPMFLIFFFSINKYEDKQYYEVNNQPYKELIF